MSTHSDLKQSIAKDLRGVAVAVGLVTFVVAVFAVDHWVLQGTIRNTFMSVANQ